MLARAWRFKSSYPHQKPTTFERKFVGFSFARWHAIILALHRAGPGKARFAARRRKEMPMDLTEQLRRYAPYNEQETRDRALILHCLETEQAVYRRENRLAHLTASAWVVNPARTKVLMAYHNIYHSWSWLGGHADGETDLLAVARREVCEESGLAAVRPLSEEIFSLEVLTVDGHVRRGEYVSSHLHLNVTYLLEADDAAPLAVKPDENSGVAWFTPEAAVEASAEPWFREHIYPKLNEKLRSRCAAEAGEQALRAAKRAARIAARARIAAVPGDRWAASGAAMAAQLLASPVWAEAKTVFCFVSLPDEADTRPILRAALAQGKRLCVPRVRGAGRMEAVAIDSLAALAPGTMGIPEPQAGETRLLAPAQIDLALVPCLAAAADGRRLGHGGGYYDRFLAAFSGVSAVFCPQAMLVVPAQLPAGPLDRAADFLLTESGLYPAQRE
jgi:5,10-methenyltetrahydrofolate synthetase